MSEPAAGPSSTAAPGALGHFLLGALLSGIVGTALAGLVFYGLVVGFLYVEHTVHGANQERITIPELADVALTPPIASLDLVPPTGKQDAPFDIDYLGKCHRLAWDAVETGNVVPTLLAMAVAAAALCMSVGLVAALARRVVAAVCHAWLGGLALLAALTAAWVVFAHFHLAYEAPWQLNAQGRLLLYAAVAGVNLLWTSLAGSRLRAFLFTFGAALAGEIFVLGLPPERVTTTVLWHSCLFLFVPAAYGWIVVERGESKGFIG